MLRDNRDDLDDVVVKHKRDELVVLTHKNWIRRLSSVTVAFFTETSSANHINAVAHRRVHNQRTIETLRQNEQVVGLGLFLIESLVDFAFSGCSMGDDWYWDAVDDLVVERRVYLELNRILLK